MAFAKISQVAHYVPEQVVTNHDLAQIMDCHLYPSPSTRDATQSRMLSYA